MNSNVWKGYITEHGCPDWPCPMCKTGVLVLEAGSLKSEAMKASMKDSAEDWWGPEQVVLSFTAWATCSNSKCGERFALSGKGGVEEDWEADTPNRFYEVFTLRHCHPTLEIISVSENCPWPVREALLAAYKLYWVDAPSTAGRIRVAVERLLDHFGIPNKTPKGGYLSLDARIDAFMKGDVANGANLMALKWLGNVGAHTVDVNVEDILSAFELLEHTLSEVIDKKSAAIAKLAQDMTKKYGKP